MLTAVAGLCKSRSDIEVAGMAWRRLCVGLSCVCDSVGLDSAPAQVVSVSKTWGGYTFGYNSNRNRPEGLVSDN